MLNEGTKPKSAAEALLMVYSAKRFAELAPGVGPTTDFFTISAAREFYMLDQSDLEFIDSIYTQGRQREREWIKEAELTMSARFSRLFSGTSG
jgi:hypothetical protein